jgi:hypothetical protein
MTDYKPKHQGLKFNTYKEFEKWLFEYCKYKIMFLDLRQDIKNMYIDEHGEILHCDYSSRAFNSKFVNVNKLSRGQRLEIYEEKSSCFLPFPRLVISDVILNDKNLVLNG